MTARGAVRWGRCPADSMISSLACGHRWARYCPMAIGATGSPVGWMIVVVVLKPSR